jgi:hypothetical protein
MRNYKNLSLKVNLTKSRYATDEIKRSFAVNFVRHADDAPGYWEMIPNDDKTELSKQINLNKAQKDNSDQELIEKALKLWSEGYTDSQVSEKLGLGRGDERGKLNRLFNTNELKDQKKIAKDNGKIVKALAKTKTKNEEDLAGAENETNKSLEPPSEASSQNPHNDTD